MATVNNAVPDILDGNVASQGLLVTDPYAGPGLLWPGTLQADHSGTESHEGTSPIVSPGAPAYDPLETDGNIPVEAGYTADEAANWLTHYAPSTPWDSNAGDAFAPSGPVSDIHGYGNPKNTRVTEPNIGNPYTSSVPNASAYEALQYDPVTGQRVSVPAGYTAHDVSFHNAMDYHSVQPIGYAVNPVYANVAQTGQPVVNDGTVYSVSGYLPDRSPQWADGSVIYETPPDPSVSVAPVAEASSYDPGAW